MKCPPFGRLPIMTLIIIQVVVGAPAASVIFGFASTPPSPSHPQSQNTTAIGSELKYETVSIKLRKSKATPDFIGLVADMEPDGIHIPAVTLAVLIRSAYAAIDTNSMGFVVGLRPNQIIGTPDWADTDLYAIDGKIEPRVAEELAKFGPSQQELARAHMLQAMLADRFKLRAHPDNKEGSVYYLVIAKNGPKLKQATPGETYPKGPGLGGLSWQAGQTVMAPSEPGSSKRVGLGAPLLGLTRILSAWLHCPVIDKTGLTGKYDFQLQWTNNENAETGPETNWPSLFTAIQQQLGLKLEPAKGPVPVMVIDHVEKPSGN